MVNPIIILISVIHVVDLIIALISVIHLQILNQTLEKQLKEERGAREMLQQQLKTVSVDVNKLSREKNEMLQVLSLKVKTSFLRYVGVSG